MWHNDIVVLQYRDSESDRLQVYKVLGRITWGRADRLWQAIMRAAAVHEEENRDWYG